MSSFSSQRIGFLSKLYLVFFVVLAPIVFSMPKDEMTIWINSVVMSQTDTTVSDFLFKYGTYLGDGTMVAVLSLIFLFIRLYYSLATAVTGLVHLIFIFIFKKIIFNGMLRPWGYFENNPAVLHHIEGVKHAMYNTFPSGHTATAFALATLLSLTAKNRAWSYVLLVLAMLTGFSRVYLNQHFVVDTYVGAMVGVVSTFITWAIFEKWTTLSQQPWMNWTVINRKIS